MMFLARWPILVDLTHPGYLAVLALLPIVVALSLRSLSGLGRWRGTIAVGIRCLVIGAMALALASPEWVRSTDDQTVTFALDQSDSVPPAQQRVAMAFMEHAAETMRSGQDRVAIVSFAGRPSVDQLPNETFVGGSLGAVADSHETNTAAALRLGLALFSERHGQAAGADIGR